MIICERCKRHITSGQKCMHCGTARPNITSTTEHESDDGFVFGLATGIVTSPMGAIGAVLHDTANGISSSCNTSSSYASSSSSCDSSSSYDSSSSCDSGSSSFD